jgi:hypothetical protein
LKKWILYILLLTGGVLLGILANRNRAYLINAQFIHDYWHFRKKIPNQREIIKSDKVMVFFAFGQSNAADYGRGEYTCRNSEVYNFYKGDLYKAKEPLLGPDGAGSSVWSRLGDMLIDSGLYKKVIIVPCGIEQSPISCWVGGGCRKKLDKTLDYLAEDSITPTHIFWQQGETDNADRTTKEEYKTRLETLISVFRNRHIEAPFYVSITSYFPYNNDYPFGIDPDIRRAQLQVTQETKNTRQGPDTDSLNLAYYRMDAVHFTEKGLDRLAWEWYKKIKAQP